MSVKKTSAEWHEENPSLIILNPTGWDIGRFQFSFYEEKISFDLFMKRVERSTHFMPEAETEAA